jgi:hypothetical protein
MSRSWLLKTCAVILVGTAACQTPTEPSLGLTMLPSDSAFVAMPLGLNGYEVRVAIRTFNNGATAVTLQTCGANDQHPMYFVAASDGESAYNPAWGCPAGSRGILLMPGAMRVDSLRLFGSAAPSARGTLEGKMYVGYLAGGRQCKSALFRVSLAGAH